MRAPHLAVNLGNAGGRRETERDHRYQKTLGKTGRKTLTRLLLVPGNDVRDHPVRDSWTHFFGQPDVAFQLLYGQTLLRVLLVLLL